MQFIPIFRKEIFSIENDAVFEKLALELFYFQAEHNTIYKSYLEHLRINISDIQQLEQIPFLSIEFFKTQEIISNFQSQILNSKIFFSSGTSGETHSKHFVSDISLYEESFRKGFHHFYGDIKKYCVLALLPSYSKDSSLVYMMHDLIKKSENKYSGFYLNNYEELVTVLKLLMGLKQKILLLGVSFALLDLAENFPMHLQHTIVMETGGMKGRKKEIVREELHEILCKNFGIDTIHSEYGMTELLSQAYSRGKGIFRCPPWMKILIRDINDPFAVSNSHSTKTGGINIIDLANIYSCAFIATQDVGKLHEDGSFEVLGRFDNSDVRGCNLLY